MKLNKLFLLGLLASASLFTACSDDDDDYTVGPQAGSINVGFVASDNVTLALTDTQFDIVLYRPDSLSAQELTVPINAVDVADVFTVPASATFAAGDSLTTVTILVSDQAQPFVDYNFHVAVPLEYAATTYLADPSCYPDYAITVHKEDYVLWGTMNYYSWLFEEAWDNDVYYSEYLKLYRSEIFAEGFPFYFTIDDKGLVEFKDNAGGDITDITTGYVHPSYGMITYRWLKTNFTGWDEDDQAYFSPVNYRVSAGSFGSNYDYFTMTKSE